MMVNVIRSWLLVLALVGGAAETRAQVKAEPTRVDLGKLKQDVTASAEVQLSNPGSQPIELLGTSADCGCTVATLKTKTLAPGEHTSLGISIQTRNYQGILHRNVRVQTSAGDITIPVDMTVIPYEHWTLVPPTVVMPSSLKDQPAITQATLQYTGEGKAELGKIECTPAWIKATTKTEDGKNFTVRLAKKADAPAGNHSIKVIFETSDLIDPRVTLNVFMPVTTSSDAANQGDTSSPVPLVALRVVPSPIIMPTVTVGQTSTKEFTLQGWRGAAAPRIEVLRGQVKLIRRQAGELGYEISFTPTRPGPATPVMRVFDGEKLELEVPVIFRAEPADIKK
jgi:Protein of unknown function (DUF1573)